MSTVQKRIDSKIGPLFLVASEVGLKGIFWKKQSVPMIMAHEASGPEAEILMETEFQLSEYLDGQRKVFELVLDADGTEFQKRVWQKLAEIPYGMTRSYKDIAIELGDAQASRAVGTANGRNPLSIVVPCHRVIASDGTLGGYAGGLSIKTFLLDMEQESTFDQMRLF
jgi:methylated-DNA-[protein]-cysteine S-methyltransferase